MKDDLPRTSMELLNFLATFSQKKTVGTLTLSRKQAFRELFFQGDFVYVVGETRFGRVSLRKLFDLGIPGQRLGIEKLEAAILKTDLTKQMLPQLFHDNGLISEAEFKAAAEEQLTEEALDLLLNNTGSFHFHEGRVPEYVLKGEDPGGRIPINLAAVLEEARRRLEFLHGFKRIVPSNEEKFVLTEKGLAFKQGGEASMLEAHVLSLMDGIRDLNATLQATIFYDHLVLTVIASALDRGFIKKRVLPELQGISLENLSMVEIENILPTLKNALKYGMDELGARERLGFALERLGRSEEAVVQYNFVGDALFRMRKFPRAVKAYERAHLMQPEEVLTTEKMVLAYREGAAAEVAEGRAGEAMRLLQSAFKLRPSDQKLFHQLLELLQREGKSNELAGLFESLIDHARATRSPESVLSHCRAILEVCPDNLLFRRKLVNLCLDFRLQEPARAAVEDLAKLCEKQSQPAKARELREKVRRLGQTPPEEPAAPRRTRKREARKESRLLRAAFLTMLLALAYQTWGLQVWMRIHEGIPRAEAAGPPVPEEAPGVRPSAEEERSVRLVSECDSFLRVFPLSPMGGEAMELRGRHRQKAGVLGGQREERKRRILDQARKGSLEGEKEAVEDLLEPFLALETADPARTEAVNLLEEVRKQDVSAARLFERGRELLASGDQRGAYQAYRRLLDTFPSSVLVGQVKLPLAIHSLPPGAEVRQLADGGDTTLLGETPVTLFLPPGGALQIELARRSFEPLRLEVSVDDSQEKVHRLQRRPAWSTLLDGRLEVAPGATTDRIFCGTTKGSLFCLERGRGKVLWNRPGEPLQVLLAPPVTTAEGAFMLWNTGRILCLPAPQLTNAAEGRGASPEREKELFLESLAVPALHATNHGALLIAGTKSGFLKAYHRTHPVAAWSFNVFEVPELICGLEKDLLASTQDGHVLRLRVEPTRNILWKRRISSSGIGAAACSDKVVVITTRRNDLVFIDAEAGQVTHALTLPEGSKVALCAAEKLVFAVDPGGAIASMPFDSPQSVTRKDLRLKCDSLVAGPGFLGVIEPGRRSLIVLDPRSLEPLWVSTAARVITHVIADQRSIIMATEDGRVTLFERE